MLSVTVVGTKYGDSYKNVPSIFGQVHVQVLRHFHTPSTQVHPVSSISAVLDQNPDEFYLCTPSNFMKQKSLR